MNVRRLLAKAKARIEVAYHSFFLKGAQVGGEPGIFFDFRLFSLTRSALDHSATAPPKSYR